MKRTFTDETGVSMTKETLSSIALVKNSKGYTWELKMYYDENNPQAADEALNELKRQDTKLQQTYGVTSA